MRLWDSSCVGTFCQFKNHRQNHSTSQHTLQLYMLLEKLLLNPSRVRLHCEKIHPFFFNTWNIGDEVFYKRNDSREWKGPGKVLGQDGSVLFIRHGSRYIKVHLCRVQPVHIQKSNHPILIIHQTSNHPILIIHQTPILTPMLNILTYVVT